ncbi:MAG: hypothetical protein ABIQ35_12630 [Verrucomicrobiota bacterium]
MSATTLLLGISQTQVPISAALSVASNLAQASRNDYSICFSRPDLAVKPWLPVLRAPFSRVGRFDNPLSDTPLTLPEVRWESFFAGLSNGFVGFRLRMASAFKLEGVFKSVSKVSRFATYSIRNSSATGQHSPTTLLEPKLVMRPQGKLEPSIENGSKVVAAISS